MHTLRDFEPRLRKYGCIVVLDEDMSWRDGRGAPAGTPCIFMESLPTANDVIRIMLPDGHTVTVEAIDVSPIS